MTFLIRQATSVHNADLVMDLFAGSGSSAAATMKLNAEDGGDRRFVMVQLPESILEKMGGVVRYINGSTFEDIQKTINIANDNDTIVLNGTYKSTGHQIVVNKSITITSKNGFLFNADFLIISY